MLGAALQAKYLSQRNQLIHGKKVKRAHCAVSGTLFNIFIDLYLYYILIYRFIFIFLVAICIIFKELILTYSYHWNLFR
jgi:hypothetical protein